MKIYLDSCCYNRPYDDQSQLRISLETQAKLYVQEMIKNSELELTTSYVLQYENSENPYEIRKRAIAEFVKSYSNEHVDYDRAEEVGIVETEQFISVIIREQFDYTKWQREKFDAMDADTFNSAAVDYAKKHPFVTEK